MIAVAHLVFHDGKVWEIEEGGAFPVGWPGGRFATIDGDGWALSVWDQSGLALNIRGAGRCETRAEAGEWLREGSGDV